MCIRDSFYGVTSHGGAGGGGTFFQINPISGEFNVIYAFCSLNCSDGSYPYGAPIQGRDGNFYGATVDGGTQGGGVLYELTLGGKYSVLYNFCYDGNNCRNNAYPTGLVQDDQGNFFGTTAWAGSYNSGSAVSYTHLRGTWGQTGGSAATGSGALSGKR